MPSLTKKTAIIPSIKLVSSDWSNPSNYIKSSLSQLLNVALVFLNATAQMGVGEGKPIGQWYGPNTVAQVLK